MQLSFFSPEEAQSLRFQIFLTTTLGQLHQVLPLKEMAALFPEPKNKVGAPGYLDTEGKIALQFLKVYEGCSDQKLLERLNADWTMQLFCGIHLQPHQHIKDKDLIWKTRKYVAQYLDIQAIQSILIDYWKPSMKHTQIGMCDATCYESYIKFPTDVKLLWDCNVWLHKQIKYWAKQLKVRRPRSKFKDQQKRQLVYARRRKKSYKLNRRRTKSLLHLCHKQIVQLADLFIQWQHFSEGKMETISIGPSIWERFATIRTIYNQQRSLFEKPGQTMGDRIVSLYKPYLNPIVRGKENKRVEFGAKVNSWQVDGLNFIEHIAFRAFHEGNRLNNGIAWHQQHFGKLAMVGADQLYATNDNRRLCSKLEIQTCFKPKGRRIQDPVVRKQQDTVRTTIGKARATILEGSYGNEKNHYGLRKVKARSEPTEVAWIFFGMMTANAMKVAKRKRKTNREKPSTRAA